MTAAVALTESDSLNDRLPTLEDIVGAAARMQGIVQHTPLQKSDFLSRKYQAEVLLKREDLQPVRSFKLRGAYNRISQLSQAERQRGVVCASAGNHAQGVAFACSALNIQGTLFMPANTPALKVNKVRQFGGAHVKVVLTGHTFDEACRAARAREAESGATFIHPFDDPDVIAGQGTLALEVLDDSAGAPIDYLFTPVGGGGLASGISTAFHHHSPATRLIGVEPSEAAALQHSRKAGHNLTLDRIDPFIDGASTQRIGERCFDICNERLHRVLTVEDQQTCQALIDLYQEEAIVAELAASLSVAALEQCREEIVGKRVVCIVSGGNNDFSRAHQIMEKAKGTDG